jgi:flagellar hook-length control protein FliK
VKINDLLSDLLGSARMEKKAQSAPAAGKTSKKQGDFDTLLQKETRVTSKGETNGNSSGAKVFFSSEAKERAGSGTSAEPLAGNLDDKDLDALAERLAVKAGWLPEKGIFASGATSETEALPELTQKEKVKGLLRLWMDLRREPSPDGPAKVEDGQKPLKGEVPDKGQKDLSMLLGGSPEAAVALSPATEPVEGLKGPSTANQKAEGALPGSPEADEKGYIEGPNRSFRGPNGEFAREMSSAPYIGDVMSEEEARGLTNAAFARAEILRRFEALVREHGIGKPNSSQGPATTEGSKMTDGVQSQKGGKEDSAAFRPFVSDDAGSKAMPGAAGGFSGKTAETADKPVTTKDLMADETSRAPRVETTAEPVIEITRTDLTQGSAIERAVTLSEGMAQVIEVIRNRNGHKGRMVLEPPELGTVRIEIQSSRDQVRLHLFVENAQARDLVDQSMDVLRQSLSRQGLTLAETMVDIDAGGNGGQAAWGSGASNDSLPGSVVPDTAEETQDPGEVIARLDIEKGLLNWIA